MTTVDFLSLPSQTTLAFDTSLCSKEIAQRFPHTPRAYVHSFGCQQNVSDSERLSGVLDSLGFDFANDEQSADLVLYNTCAVRESAETKVYGHIGELKALKRQHPNMLIVICGCMAQREQVQQKLKESYPFVDIVFGTGAIHKLPRLILERIQGEKHVFFNQSETKVVEDIPVRRENGVRAWLPIMQGCNNFCSYCIVPYVRGREVSRAPQKITEQAREILAEGYSEITLLGQNVNSYGKTDEFDTDFAALVRELDLIEGEHWIRFMTSHPKDCTEALIDTVSESTHFCHHIHLPIQSGSNRILEQMNRRYTVERYKQLVAYARKKMPDVTFSSDIIVGFPGESREDFQKTMELIKEIRYNALFTFNYSKRSGTPAAQLPDPTTQEEKTQWMRELIAAQQKICGEINSQMVGTVQKVLLDGVGRAEGVITGRTQGNIIVETMGDPKLVGSFVNVLIKKAMNAAIIGDIE